MLQKKILITLAPLKILYYRDILTKRHVIIGEKIFAIYVTDRGITSEYLKNSQKTIRK